MGPPKGVHVPLFKGIFGCHHFCRDHVKAKPPLLPLPFIKLIYFNPQHQAAGTNSCSGRLKAVLTG